MNNTRTNHATGGGSGARSRGRRKSSSNSAVIVVVPLLVLGSGAIWLLLAILFGGLGGHQFSTLSKLEFLDDSQNTYYGSHEEMMAAEKAYKDRLAKMEKDRRRSLGNQSNNSAFGQTYSTIGGSASSSDSVLVFAENARSRAINRSMNLQRVQRETYTAAPSVSATARYQSSAAVRRSEHLQRADVLELLDLTSQGDVGKGQQQEILPEEILKRLSLELTQEGTEQDIELLLTEDERLAANLAQQDFSEIAESAVLSTAVANAPTETVARDKVSAATIAGEIRIDFLDDKCGTLNDRFKPVPVQFRPGGYAIKGASYDKLDAVILVARRCGNVRLSILPTLAGIQEDLTTDKDLLGRRVAEIKYYLMQRRIPKQMIALHSPAN